MNSFEHFKKQFEKVFFKATPEKIIKGLELEVLDCDLSDQPNASWSNLVGSEIVSIDDSSQNCITICYIKDKKVRKLSVFTECGSGKSNIPFFDIQCSGIHTSE